MSDIKVGIQINGQEILVPSKAKFVGLTRNVGQNTWTLMAFFERPNFVYGHGYIQSIKQQDPAVKLIELTGKVLELVNDDNVVNSLIDIEKEISERKKNKTHSSEEREAALYNLAAITATRNFAVKVLETLGKQQDSHSPEAAGKLAHDLLCDEHGLLKNYLLSLEDLVERDIPGLLAYLSEEVGSDQIKESIQTMRAFEEMQSNLFS